MAALRVRCPLAAGLVWVHALLLAQDLPGQGPGRSDAGPVAVGPAAAAPARTFLMAAFPATSQDTLSLFTSSDGVLALTYPNAWRLMGNPPQPHIGDEALLVHLRREGTADAGRFMHWAERTITFPARRLRERL